MKITMKIDTENPADLVFQADALASIWVDIPEDLLAEVMPLEVDLFGLPEADSEDTGMPQRGPKIGKAVFSPSDKRSFVEHVPDGRARCR